MSFNKPVKETAEQEAARLRKGRDEWKAFGKYWKGHYKSLSRKSKTKIATLRSLIFAQHIIVVLSLATVFLNTQDTTSIQSVPTAYEYPSQEIILTKASPPWVLSAIKVKNGGIRCSATIIDKSEYSAIALSAAHCFKGVIGGEFDAEDAFGKSFKAQLLGIDRKNDLALFCIAPSSATGVACVPISLSKEGSYNKLGYTKAGGLKWARVRLRSNRLINSSVFNVDAGAFGSGDSGGTVVQVPGNPPNWSTGHLISVISARPSDSIDGLAYEIIGCDLASIDSFLTRHDGILKKRLGRQLRRCPPDG